MSEKHNCGCSSHKENEVKSKASSCGGCSCSHDNKKNKKTATNNQWA
ncbi:hypothetical protein ACQPU1_04545 [Clostridium paraputrificum]